LFWQNSRYMSATKRLTCVAVCVAVLLLLLQRTFLSSLSRLTSAGPGDTDGAPAACGELDDLVRAGAGVPPLVHQSWAARPLPEIQERPFEHLNGPFEHTLWTDADNRELWARFWPAMLPVFDAYESSVARAEATRLLYLHVCESPGPSSL
jgi:hypothetical protein